MTKYIYKGQIPRSCNDLYHYGRSKEDGAPGVGTGNWRRSGGGVFSGLLSKFKKKKDATTSDNKLETTQDPQKKAYKDALEKRGYKKDRYGYYEKATYFDDSKHGVIRASISAPGDDNVRDTDEVNKAVKYIEKNAKKLHKEFQAHAKKMIEEDAKEGLNYGFDPDNNPSFIISYDGTGFEYSVWDNATNHFVISEYHFNDNKYRHFSHEG